MQSIFADQNAIPTPFFSHMKKYPDVYEPAEDTFLLLDSLEEDKDFLKDMKPKISLEIGGGSGVVTCFLATILGPSTTYICTDRNPKAVSCILETAKVNKHTVEAVETDLFSGLEERLTGNVDVLMFNPPYVVTPDHEIDSSNVASTWAGGARGRLVMDRLFPHVSTLLSNKGVFYLVVIKENDPDEIIALFKREYGFSGEFVKTRKCCNELLSVLKFTRGSVQPAAAAV